MNIKIISTEEELKQAFAIRTKVFIEEQNVPPEEEIDDLEDVSTHFLVTDEDGSPMGTGRFRILDGYGKVERICILADYRSKGVGFALMEAIEKHALAEHVEILKLNAQTQAIPFYEKLGYGISSDIFLDAGIPHRAMKKHL